MTTKPEAHPDSVNGCLAEYLATKKETILTDWRERVRRDKAITTSRSLNTTALTNGLPEIFDDLIETLRRYGCDVVAGQSVKDAEDHGSTRQQQGYELPEVLRELMHLRSILIYHMRQFEDLYPDFGMAARLFVSTTLHQFLDKMAIDATEEFLWSQLSPQDQIGQGLPHWRATE